MLHVQDVSESADALHKDIEAVFVQSGADGTASRVSPYLVVGTRVYKSRSGAVNIRESAQRLMIETSCTAGNTCETQPRDGPSVFESTQ